MFQTNFRLVKHCLSDTDIWIELVSCLPSADKGSKASKQKMQVFFHPIECRMVPLIVFCIDVFIDCYVKCYIALTCICFQSNNYGIFCFQNTHNNLSL